MSGVAVADDCLIKFEEMKMAKKFNTLILKISENMKEVEVEQAKDTNFEEDFRDILTTSEPRYIVYDFIVNENTNKKILQFIAWVPDSAAIKKKMVYASTKEMLKKKLNGIHQNDWQCGEYEDFPGMFQEARKNELKKQ